MAADRYRNDCLTLLSYLANEGYNGLVATAEATGLTRSEVRRYLLPEATQKADYDQLLTWREKKPRSAYKMFLENFDGNRLNTSKHNYLRLVAAQYGYALLPKIDYPYIEVVKMDTVDFGVTDSNIIEERIMEAR